MSTGPLREELPAALPGTASSLLGRLPVGGGWCTAAREDPITGLVAFPDFDAHFPHHLTQALRRGLRVGLAIGDVDRLKEYVEAANAADPTNFGHLAGNALMAQLGRLTTAWFDRQMFGRGCVSTFGGDEVIIAAEVPALGDFHDAVRELRDKLGAALPRTVSFALAVLGPEALPPAAPGPGAPRHLYTHLVATVDRCLFARKVTRTSGTDDGLVTIAALPPLPPPGGNHDQCR